MMLPEGSVSNHGSDPQNVTAGIGPQSNFNGSGTQNNYYGSIRDTQASEAERLRKEKTRCLRSLSFPTMNSRRNRIDDAHPGTCDWLLCTTEFRQWLCGDDLGTHNGVLWIKGKPGAGKSTLMNNTLSYCEKEYRDHLIVSHFFNGRGESLEMSPLGMLRSIIYQIIRKDNVLCEVLLEVYRENIVQRGEQFQWQEPELKKFLRGTAKQPHFHSRPLLLFVDALDECEEEAVRDVVSFFESLSVDAMHHEVDLKICLSSRHYPRVTMKSNLELIVESQKEHGIDIATYVREKLVDHDKSITSQIKQKARGIFMWVVLAVAMLNKAYDEGRHEAMQKTLDEIPEDLEGIFITILGKSGPNKTEMIHMLQWVLLSRRTLSAEELYTAVVGNPLPSKEIIRRRIISSSKGLIETREADFGEEVVQLIHLSVKDFLCRSKRLEMLDPKLEPDAIAASHGDIWAQCWSYIRNRKTVSGEEKDGKYSIGESPFNQYVMGYILYHAEKTLSNATIASRLDTDICHWLDARDTWSHLLQIEESLDEQLTTGHDKLLCALTVVPCPNLFNIVVDKGVDINATLSNGFTLLECALTHGGYASVQLLIQKGAEVNRPHGRGSYLHLVTLPLMYEIAELLVENGADFHAADIGNVLVAASSRGNKRLVRLLVEKGVDVNTQAGFYGNALTAACFNGHDPTVRFLLQEGANINAEGGYHGNALVAACTRGHISTARLLLQEGANVNAQGGEGSTALHVSCEHTRRTIATEMVNLLLQNGANVNAWGGRMGDALHTAAYWRRGDLVLLLLVNGAVHAQGCLFYNGKNLCELCKHRCVRTA